jgi:hypothetical protein
MGSGLAPRAGYEGPVHLSMPCGGYPSRDGRLRSIMFHFRDPSCAICVCSMSGLFSPSLDSGLELSHCTPCSVWGGVDGEAFDMKHLTRIFRPPAPLSLTSLTTLIGLLPGLANLELGNCES